MVGVPALVQAVAFGPVLADRLAHALARLQQVDQRPTEQKAEDKRGKERPAGAKGDVSKQVPDIAAIGQLLRK
jgi:hypothetical protein